MLPLPWLTKILQVSKSTSATSIRQSSDTRTPCRTAAAASGRAERRRPDPRSGRSGGTRRRSAPGQLPSLLGRAKVAHLPHLLGDVSPIVVVEARPCGPIGRSGRPLSISPFRFAIRNWTGLRGCSWSYLDPGNGCSISGTTGICEIEASHPVAPNWWCQPERRRALSCLGPRENFPSPCFSRSNPCPAMTHRLSSAWWGRLAARSKDKLLRTTAPAETTACRCKAQNLPCVADPRSFSRSTLGPWWLSCSGRVRCPCPGHQLGVTRKAASTRRNWNRQGSESLGIPVLVPAADRAVIVRPFNHAAVRLPNSTPSSDNCGRSSVSAC